ncbi:Cytochrome b-c1 complex subunit 6 [Plasmodiophora brassicae]|uniref:Cytochrome b-c1 complex subunit 6 n=1 Tax=Plasmodiophora brassicae TaxID=37360 RepID=A0A0G4IKR6_PLABS|nr:hypothetical protein PBRA_004467 [Plasmodiophora brassicae]SPR00007.1 unnamed protein product [Plasmodiophora brassicae]
MSSEDPKPQIDKDCHHHCVQLYKAYEACAKRIEGDESGEKNCNGYIYKYWHCTDHCMAPKLFSLLK